MRAVHDITAGDDHVTQAVAVDVTRTGETGVVTAKVGIDGGITIGDLETTARIDHAVAHIQVQGGATAVAIHDIHHATTRRGVATRCGLKG